MSPSGCYSIWMNEADHEHSIKLVIPVKTGIQEYWIPASAGMTGKTRRMGKVDFSIEPLAFEVRVV